MKHFVLGMAFMGSLMIVSAWAADSYESAARIIKDAAGMTRVGVLAAGQTANGGTAILRVDDQGRVICGAN